MCGICGIISYARNDIDESRLQKMCAKLRHRGPDDQGLYLSKKNPAVGLGHRRLSIIDLSSHGRQPMPNEDMSAWIALNGEIYNFKELKSGLKEKGHKFESDTDTETVIHLYEEYGRDCVDYLRGMFAFAIWDEKKKMLLAARDRFGKKPLLYCFDNATLCFASEFSALLESGLVKKEINYEAMHYYLTFGYIPSPFTIYKEVFMLPPGHRLILKEGKLSIERYWQLDYSRKIKISENDAAAELMRLLKESVKLRLYSDVPLGAFLSGGIDSSIVVALMSELSSGRVKTFSVGFSESAYNELNFARNIANKYNTEHHEFTLKPNALEVLPLLVEHYGQPYADSSCIPTYYVSRETRKYVTVALNGDGGDELFAGYERYQAMLISEYYHRLPPGLRDIAAGFFKMFPDSLNPKNRLRNIKRFFQAVNLPTQQRYLRWIGVFDSAAKESLYSQDFKNQIIEKDPSNLLSPYFNDNRDNGLLDRILMTDSNRYLPDDLLVKVDIASMLNSLEARSPFLDHKFAEFAARLPAQFKLKRLIKKYILKKAIRGMVPPENIQRRKMGFGVPIGEWFRTDLKNFLSETLICKKSLGRGYFNPDTVRDLVRQHLEGKADHAYKLWTLLMLELWHKRFID